MDHAPDLTSIESLAGAQHGVLSARQLRELGVAPAELRRRLDRGELRAVLPGVYAVGRALLSAEGRSTAALLSALAGLTGAQAPPVLRAAIDAARARTG